MTTKKKIEPPKKPEEIYLEFIQSNKKLTSINFGLNKAGIKKRLKDSGEYNKLGFQIIFKYLHLKLAQLYLFILQEWLWYCKFCYSISLKKEGKHE
jgi:hypothetical protein